MQSKKEIKTTKVPNAKLLSQEEQMIFLERWRRDGNNKDRDVLIYANLALIHKFATPYNSSPHFKDLIQEGVLGLIRGLEKYDTARAVKLSTYLAMWIKAKIFAYILHNQSLVKAGTSKNQNKSFWKYDKLKTQLIQDGIDPTDAIMAELFETTPDQLYKLERPTVVYATDEEMPPLECAHPEEFYLQKENKVRFDTILKAYCDQLSPRERDLVENNMFEDKEDSMTLTALAAKHGVTKQRMNQIKDELIKTMKIRFKEFDGPRNRTRNPTLFAKR